MRERELVQTLAERLQCEGFCGLQVRPGNQRGAGIESILPRSILPGLSTFGIHILLVRQIKLWYVRSTGDFF